jgi:hypothetical protein
VRAGGTSDRSRWRSSARERWPSFLTYPARWTSSSSRTSRRSG